MAGASRVRTFCPGGGRGQVARRSGRRPRSAALSRTRRVRAVEAADLLDVPADLPVHPWYLRRARRDAGAMTPPVIRPMKWWDLEQVLAIETQVFGPTAWPRSPTGGAGAVGPALRRGGGMGSSATPGCGCCRRMPTCRRSRGPEGKAVVWAAHCSATRWMWPGARGRRLHLEVRRTTGGDRTLRERRVHGRATSGAVLPGLL